MAAAQVSGAAALILAVQPLSTTSLKADILRHVHALGSLAGKVRTGGRLDVCGAIRRCALACRVPKLAGLTVRRARQVLRRAHCTLGKVIRVRSARVRAGRVISQRPRRGTMLSPGARVRVVVARRATG
jgi:hypothetical protein